MKKFNDVGTQKAILKWIRLNPDGENGYDRKDFYDFLHMFLKNDESISMSELAEIVIDNTSWVDQEYIDEFIDKYIDKINEMKEFYDHLLESNRIKLL